MHVEPLTFQTEDGLKLEGELRRPDGLPRASAVICHPHPEHGGSKDHPLLWAIRIDLAGRGIAVLTFNFRGLMGSEGEFGGGVEEVKDVRAAVGSAREVTEAPTFVVGWSFGANTALREAMSDDRIASLALIGLPLAESSLDVPPLPGPEELRAFDRPVLLLAGSADPYCPVDELRAFGRQLPRRQVTILQGTDHYFPKREPEAARIVGEFATRTLLEREER
jgi:uncharacterized protein